MHYLLRIFIFVSFLATGVAASAQITDEQLQKIKNTFANIDTDGDGKYALTEWWVLYERDSRPGTIQNLNKIFADADIDGDKKLSLNEYAIDTDSTPLIKEFNSLDSNKDEFVMIEELVAHNDKNTAASFEKIVTQLDTNKNGFIDLDEYIEQATKITQQQQQAFERE